MKNEDNTLGLAVGWVVGIAIAAAVCIALPIVLS
jgi:hypothetical protein